MTTSSQQTVLTDAELAGLRAIATAGATDQVSTALRDALAAKGMLATEDGAHYHLTPAGAHAVDVTGPGNVPGIDT